MTGNERLKKNIVKFLELFNLFVSSDDENDLMKKLYNGQNIYLYNDSMDAVGQMTFTKDGLCIYSMSKDYIFSAMSKRNIDGLLDFEYSINEINNYNNCLKGKYFIQKGKKLDGILIRNVIDIYHKGRFVGKCVFDTLRNYFYMYDISNKVIAIYRNNEFKYNDKQKEVNITHEKGNVMYEIDYLHYDEKHIYGNKIIDHPLQSIHLYKIEQTMSEIIEEFNDEYYENIDYMKNIINDFSDNLFENLACSSLKNFDRKQLDSILKIDFSKYKGKSKIKK